jgi:hypothetical protein
VQHLHAMLRVAARPDQLLHVQLGNGEALTGPP